MLRSHARRMGFGQHRIPISHWMSFPGRRPSAMTKEIQGNLADLSGVALNIWWKQSSLVEWVYTAMREMAMKPSLWIHAWRHLTAASEEEHKVNVNLAKRASTAYTLFTSTRHGTVTKTTATCEDGMVPKTTTQRSGFCMREKLRKQMQQPPRRSTSSTARAPATVSSRNRRLELTRETA